MEMLPWDVWGMMDMNDAALTEEKQALVDRVAALTIAGDEKFGEVREIYESEERLRVPPVVFNALRNGPEASVTPPLGRGDRRESHLPPAAGAGAGAAGRAGLGM